MLPFNVMHLICDYIQMLACFTFACCNIDSVNVVCWVLNLYQFQPYSPFVKPCKGA